MKTLTTAVIFCFALPLFAQQKGMNLETKFLDFIPIPPIEYVGDVELYTKENEKPITVTTSIKELSSFSEYKDELLKLMPNYGMRLTIKTNNAKDGLSYGSSTASIENEFYEMVFDFALFSAQPVKGEDGKVVATAKLGTSIRLTASIVTKKKDLQLSDLFQLGVYADNESLSGSLAMEVFGIESPEILSLIPAPAEINVQSVQSALQAVAAIKARIYEPKTRLHPQVLALRPEVPDVTIEDILTKYKSPNYKSVEVLHINYQQQNQLQQLLQLQQQKLNVLGK